MGSKLIQPSDIKSSTLEVVAKALKIITAVENHVKECQCCRDALKDKLN